MRQTSKRKGTIMDKKTSIKLVKLYQQHRLLWDTLDASFYIKDMRKIAWKNISLKLKLPVNDIRKKITNIRGILRKERFKCRKCSADGTAYNSKWFLFKHLSFLADIRSNQPSDTRPSTSSTNSVDPLNVKSEKQDDTDTQSENEGELENNDTDEPLTWVSVADQQIRPANTKVTKFQISKTKNVFQQDDVYDSFGKLVASELRKYDNHTLAHVKKAIMDIIFKADMDMLDVSEIKQKQSFVSKEQE